MIDKENLTYLKNWFANYVHTFKNEDIEIQKNIDMKEEHTKRVCKEIFDFVITFQQEQNITHVPNSDPG